MIEDSVVNVAIPNVIPRFLRLDLAQERFIGGADDLHDASELIYICNG